MSEARILQEKARMFERRAEKTADETSRQHLKEMAAHYRSLAVEHLDVHRGAKLSVGLKYRGHPQ
jgi:hypothetical protein